MPTRTKPKHRTPAEDQVHEFELILDGPPGDLPEEAWDRLFEAGCDDATIGKTAGVWRATFHRAAPSLAQAIATAIAAVESAGVGLEVEQVEAEDVQLSTGQVAERAGVSREAVRLWATGKVGPGGFPRPVSSASGAVPMYRWVEVAEWLARHRGDLPGPPVEEDHPANVVAYVNAWLGQRRLGPKVPAAREAVETVLGPPAARARGKKSR